MLLLYVDVVVVCWVLCVGCWCGYRFCKHNTSNDMFSRCKSVQNMATGKSDDQLIQPDNKLKIGTRSGKFRIGHDYV